MAKVYGNRICTYELVVVGMVYPMAIKQFNIETWLNASGVKFYQVSKARTVKRASTCVLCTPLVSIVGLMSTFLRQRSQGT